MAGEVRAIPEGVVALSGSLPAVWSLNHVRISGPVTYEQAVEICERHMGALSYRQLYLDHEPSGRLLAESFRAEGWEVDVEVHMELARGRREAFDTAVVVEDAGEDECLALMERWLGEDPTLKLNRDEMEQLVQYNRLTWRSRGARRLGVRDREGRLLAMTLLFYGERVVQVEDVYAVPDARGRGYGKALVSRAVQLALDPDPELVFIVADDNDWPKHLYERAGFLAAGRTWLLHRPARGL